MAKHQWGTKTIGNYDGQPVRLRMAIPASTERSAPASQLWIGSTKITLNGSLPARLARLCPSGYAHATLADWLPFLQEATSTSRPVTR